MKNIWKQFFRPTPKRLVKWGYALLGVSTFVTASAISGNVKWLAYTALGIGVLGKFLTDFFTEQKE